MASAAVTSFDSCTRRQIFPLEMKVGMAVVGVAAAFFAVFAVIHQLYPFAAIVAGATGGSEALLAAVWVGIRRVSEDAEKPPAIMQSPPPTEVEVDWKRWLDLPPERANLANGTQTVAEKGKAGYFEQIPYLGHYDPKGYSLGLPCIQWRLPPSQLAAFPEGVRRVVAGHNPHLFCLVVNDVNGIDASDPSRNLMLHGLVLPDYKAKKGARKEHSVTIGAFEPKGISSYPETKDALPFGTTRTQKVILHDRSSISPNNVRFVLDPNAEWHSLFVAARYRGQACAFYMIMMRQPLQYCATTVQEFAEEFGDPNIKKLLSLN